MKNLILLATFLSFALYSCNNEGSDSKTSDAADKVEIDMDGPDFEMNVISFSVEDRRTQVELTNRMGEAITSVSGRLNFMNEDGAAISRATGAPITSPFQQAANPHVVDAKSIRNISLGNDIPEGTASINISEIKVVKASGEEATF